MHKLLGALVVLVALTLLGQPAGADTRPYNHTHCNAYTVTLTSATTSTCLPHQYARRSGTQTVVYVVAPPQGDYWVEYYLNKSIRDFDALADFRVVRRSTDPGYNYNVILVRRKVMNGGSSYAVWDFADPHRAADLAAGIKRRTVVTFDNSRPWAQVNAAAVVPHEIKGHALGSLDHSPPGYTYGPTNGTGNLTTWDRYLVGLQNRGLVAGAPAGAL